MNDRLDRHNLGIKVHYKLNWYFIGFAVGNLAFWFGVYEIVRHMGAK